MYGFCTQLLLKWMRRLGATTDQQIALTFACAYLSFYTANGPINVSGDHVVSADSGLLMLEKLRRYPCSLAQPHPAGIAAWLNDIAALACVAPMLNPM